MKMVSRRARLGVQAVLAAAAMLALPAFASAEITSPAHWTLDGAAIPQAEQLPVELTGELEFEIPALNATYGPCQVHIEGTVANDEAFVVTPAQGSITDFEFETINGPHGTPCATSEPGCEVVEAGAIPGSLPWHSEAGDMGGAALFDEIQGIEFFNTFGPGCGELEGITFLYYGSVAGGWNAQTGDLEFVHTGGLQGEVPGVTTLGRVFVSGFLHLSASLGGELGLEAGELGDE